MIDMRETLRAGIPGSPNTPIPWDIWERGVLASDIRRMAATPQNPHWHAEGDVWTHTKRVCEALVADPLYREMPQRGQEILFMAALLHDIGKVTTTIVDGEQISSPGHARAGTRRARQLLWETMGIGGTQESIAYREAICLLIRYHGMPLHMGEREDPERELIQIAACGEVVPEFTLHSLYLLVRADIRGRIAPDTATLLEEADFTYAIAEELGITHRPYPFPNAVTKHAYLRGGRVARDYPLYDETRQEVILLSGLPGTGKDTYIGTHYPHHVMISLDEIRRELDISPTDREGQGRVIQAAKERARELLREKIPFVWNATNLMGETRGMVLALFAKYGAYVRIVYLETDTETALARNRARARTVPEDAVRHMRGKTEPPLPHEAHEVAWVTT